MLLPRHPRQPAPCRVVGGAGQEPICYFMDIYSQPVWRGYLKAIVRIHVDAGVDGIQFDEPDSPLAALNYGRLVQPRHRDAGFTEYLKGLEPGVVPASAGDLADFHYGQWLLGRGSSACSSRPTATRASWPACSCGSCRGARRRTSRSSRPMCASTRHRRTHRAGVVQPVRRSAVARPAGREVVDVLVPEQRRALYEQAWMDAAHRGVRRATKAVRISTNPYGGVTPRAPLPKLNRGKAFDRYRVMMFEAAAMGVNLSVPYGRVG